jgi:hypothetical protein
MKENMSLCIAKSLKQRIIYIEIAVTFRSPI